MKNSKFLNLLALFCTMSSCTSTILPEPVDPEYANNNGDTVKIRDDQKLLGNRMFYYTDLGFAVPIVGDTIVSFRKIKLPGVQKPDLSSLKNAKKGNAPFRMVAIGGALAAGMRDFGLYNESMVTSYPNILANQMGVDFKLPLFNAEDYNGFERKVVTTYNPTSGPAVKVKTVVNNVDLNRESAGNHSQRGNYYEGDADNLARPFPNSLFFNRHKKHVREDLKLGSQPDFVIFEIDPLENSRGFGPQVAYQDLKGLMERDWEKYPTVGYYIPTFGSQKYDDLARDIKNRGIEKGVIVNIVSNSLRRAKEKDYSQELSKIMEIYQKLALYPSVAAQGNITYGHINSGEYVVSAQTSTMDSLLSPAVHAILKPGFSHERPGYALQVENYLKVKERENTDKNIDLANKTLSVYSEYLDMPVFDLNGLYKAIHAGNYVTQDGVKVDPNFVGGNFFSADRTTPTAFGQAVIANEVIKTINAYYKTRIPLIETKYFLQF